MENFSPRLHDRYPLNADIRIIDAAGDVALLTMLDISLGGLRADGLTHFGTDLPVSVEFPDGGRRAGRTMWRDDFSSGIHFDTPLTAAELLELIASPTLDRTSAVRE